MKRVLMLVFLIGVVEVSSCQCDEIIIGDNTSICEVSLKFNKAIKQFNERTCSNVELILTCELSYCYNMGSFCLDIYGSIEEIFESYTKYSDFVGLEWGGDCFVKYIMKMNYIILYEHYLNEKL